MYAVRITDTDPALLADGTLAANFFFTAVLVKPQQT